MNRVDQCLYLLDGIAKCYGKVLRFSFFFCQIMDNLSGCQDPNCDVHLFIERLVNNIKSKRLMDEEKDFLWVIV